MSVSSHFSFHTDCGHEFVVVAIVVVGGVRDVPLAALCCRCFSYFHMFLRNIWMRMIGEIR